MMQRSNSSCGPPMEQDIVVCFAHHFAPLVPPPFAFFASGACLGPND
jgi:hypothetical protein